MEELKKVLEELKERNINITDLKIADEIKWQLEINERNFSTSEQQKIWDYVNKVYLKSENLTIESIAKAVINNFDNLDNMDIWNLIEDACYE